MVLLTAGCQKLRDKVSTTLYQDDAPVDEVWTRDSTLVAGGPSVLFRSVYKGPTQLIMPVATLSQQAPRTLRMSKRGWSAFDIDLLYSGKEVTPVRDGSGGSPIRMRQGMWENAAAPLDTMARCNSMIPVGLIPSTPGTDLFVVNYKLPTGMKSLSAAQVEAAISGVPTLVTPTVGVSAAQLARYSRTVRQVLRVGEEPAVLLEYHDRSTSTDTSTIARRRPRHMIIVMEKGNFMYRAGWVYSTTGASTDRPVLEFLDSIDLDGDGRSELVFSVPMAFGNLTRAFHLVSGTWKELWTRPPARCDG